MKEKLFDPSVLEMLEEFKKIAQSQGIDFFIAGAIARDIRLSINPEMKAIRRTKDVDIALMVTDEQEFYKMKEALLATGNSEQLHERVLSILEKRTKGVIWQAMAAGMRDDN